MRSSGIGRRKREGKKGRSMPGEAGLYQRMVGRSREREREGGRERGHATPFETDSPEDDDESTSIEGAKR